MAGQKVQTGFFNETLTRFPALIPDSATAPSLTGPSAPTVFFQYPGVASGRLLTLRSFQHPATANMQLSLFADSYQPSPVDAAADALLAPDQPALGDHWNAPAASNLTMRVRNADTSGGTVDTFWSNWSILAEKPSLAQRLKFAGRSGIAPLTTAEQALAAQLGITGPNARSLMPRTFEWVLENEFRSQILSGGPYANRVTITSGGPETFAIETAGANDCLVLAGFQSSGGSGSDGLTFTFIIDEQTSFLTLNGYESAQAYPPPIFLLAAQSIQIDGNVTSTSANVTAVANIWHVRLTPEVQVRMGQLTSGPVYDRIVGGVI